MSKKPFHIKPKSELMRIEKELDNWVMDTKDNNVSSFKPQNYEQPEKPVIDESRFTIVIPTYLHRRIKKNCAAKGESLKDTIKNILLENFPET